MRTCGIWATTHSFLFPSPAPSVFQKLSSGAVQPRKQGPPPPIPIPISQYRVSIFTPGGANAQWCHPLVTETLSSPGRCQKKDQASSPPTQPTLAGKKLYSRHDRPKILDPQASHPSRLLGQVLRARRKSPEDLRLLSPSPTSLQSRGFTGDNGCSPHP